MFYNKDIISGTTLLGIWKLEEGKEELLNSLDRHDHLEEILNIKSEARILERLATRLLIKELLGEEKQINYLDSGKPYLVDNSYHISISHTKGYVAVALDKDRSIGLDIEYIAEKVRRVKSRFISSEEYIDMEQELVHLLLHWTAKEAMFKFIDAEGIDFKEHLFVERFLPRKQGIFYTVESRTLFNHKFDAHYWVTEDFVLTCLLKS